MNQFDQLLLQLKEEGVRLEVHDGNIRAVPKPSLELHQQIKARKAEILAFLDPQPSPESEMVEFRRVAAFGGCKVRAGGIEGVLDGVFRDRAVIKGKGFWYSANLTEVELA